MNSSVSSVRSTVLSVFEQVAREQNCTLKPLTDSLALVDSGLDSLSLAIVVGQLEDELGVDPFSALDASAFPVTLGDFVAMYEHAR